MAWTHPRCDRGRAEFLRGLTGALLEFARAHFALLRPDFHQKGKTRLQVLRDVQRQTGIVAEELSNLPSVPFEAAHVWEWFRELSDARQVGMDVSPIAWADISAYFALRRVEPQQWEIDAIRLIDEAYLESRAEKTAGGAVKGAKAMNRVAGKKQ